MKVCYLGHATIFPLGLQELQIMMENVLEGGTKMWHSSSNGAVGGPGFQERNGNDSGLLSGHRTDGGLEDSVGSVGVYSLYTSSVRFKLIIV